MKLLNCPFCGGAAEVHLCAELENECARLLFSGRAGVHCTVCHIATIPCASEEEAIEIWNRRSDNEQRAN